MIVQPDSDPESHSVPRTFTRTGIAWMAACTAGVLAVLLIIFMVQNTSNVQVSFLWMQATTSLALMLLIAAVGGIVLTLILGTARIMQLRHLVHRRSTERATTESS